MKNVDDSVVFPQNFPPLFGYTLRIALSLLLLGSAAEPREGAGLHLLDLRIHHLLGLLFLLLEPLCAVLTDLLLEVLVLLLALLADLVAQHLALGKTLGDALAVSEDHAAAHLVALDAQVGTKHATEGELASLGLLLLVLCQEALASLVLTAHELLGDVLALK